MESAARELPASFLTRIAAEFPADFLSRSAEDLETFGKDWTKVYAPKPSAIAFPRTTDEVARLCKLCSELKIPVVPSGGRTGLSGGAVAPNGEVVLSLTRMNRMDAVDPLAQTVRVQAGAVTEAVHHHCASHGLTWPVDFASKGSSHVGGNLATNAGGVKVIHYGMTRNWVLGLQVVTMQGEVMELNGALEKNASGLDLRHLFISSEGTLGIITEATLKLTRLPRELDVFFFAVKDISAVFRLFMEARRAPFSLMAFECLTKNCMDVVREARGLTLPFSAGAADTAGAFVLMEVERPSSAEAQAVLDEWLAGQFEREMILDGTLAQSPREAKDLWSIREGTPEALFMKGFLHKNDISLPIYSLEKFLAEMYEMFAHKHKGFDVYTFGHIGDGNLHINTMKPEPMSKEDFLKAVKLQDKDLFDLVRKHQGSVSGEHGIGLLKKDSIAYSRSPIEIAYLKAIKKVFDPQGLLNPGKILD